MPGQREIVCDLDGGIANFWRAVTADPDLVAAYSDYPNFSRRPNGAAQVVAGVVCGA